MKKRFLSYLAITMMIATSIQAQIPTNGLVAYYPFSGNADDSSGNGNNGTVNGASLATDRFGKANSAYFFNGTSNYIEVPNSNSLYLKNHFTLSAWIKISDYSVSSTDAISSIFGKPRQSGWATGYSLWAYQNPYNKSAASFNGVTADGVQSTLVTPINQWVHVLCTYDSINLKLYINGKLDTTVKTSFTLGNYSTPLYIGTEFIPSSTNWNRFFKGTADDIAIWNRALDSSEVKSVYHQGGYNGTLPLSLIEFIATNKESCININWQTASEINTENFIIQRSTNGNSYTDIGTLQSVGNGANNYQFIDRNPENGINFYRLQSVDKDGSSSYSKIVSLKFGNKQSFSIVPNPAKDFATISFNKLVDKATIAVCDMAGKQVITKSLNEKANSYKLNTQSLKSGLYVIKVNTATGSYNEKLLINK